MIHGPSPARRRVYAVVGIAVLVAFVAVSVAAFDKAFVPAVLIKLQADRSGLLMERGNDVRLRGVPIGDVRAVDPDGAGGALLTLAVDPDQLRRIPVGTTAELRPATAFGPKQVELQAPAGPVTVAARAGDVLRTSGVTTEVNDVFMGLQQVLTTVEPSKLNATLGSIARAVDGRGRRLGDYLADLNGYLGGFDDSLPALKRDITLTGDVAGVYADAAPDLLRVADHATTTSRTLTETEAMLHQTLVGFTRAADDGGEFLDRLEEPLITGVHALDPTLALLDRYSPALTCTVQGLDEGRRRFDTALGQVLPGVNGNVGLLPAQEGYQYPRDLPKLVTGQGPDCFHLPVVSPDVSPVPRVRFDDGTQNVYRGSTDALSLPRDPVATAPSFPLGSLAGERPVEPGEGGR